MPSDHPADIPVKLPARERAGGVPPRPIAVEPQPERSRTVAGPQAAPSRVAGVRSALAFVLSSPTVRAVAVVCLGLLLLFGPTALSIAAIWERSETFAHGFIVIPMCLWLAWRQRE